MPMEVNDSNWKAPCYNRLQELLKKQFDSSVNHMQIGVIEDTMSYELYKAVCDEKEVVNRFLDVLENINKFLDVLEKVCRDKQQDCSTILRQTTPTGDTLLHVAAEYGRDKIAELLVDNYFSLHVTNIRKDTPLHAAARARSLGVMKVILSKFRDVDKDAFIMSPNESGNTALHEAILSKHHEGLGYILSEQSSESWPSYWDTKPAKSPIYVAIETKDEKILHHLLQIPFPSKHVIHNCRGNSPLHAAISKQNAALLQKMLDEKEELMWFRDEHRNTPLHYAACTGYVEGVRKLLRKSTLASCQRNSNGNLPIHLACEKGHVQVVEELLGKERPHARFWLNNKGQNILHIAAEKGPNGMVKYLLKHKKIHHEIVNERDLNGNTPLHLASRKFHLWTLLHLSQYSKINVNLVNDKGLTALDIVRMHCKVPMPVQEYGANLILITAGVPAEETMLGVQNEANKRNVNEAANTLIIVATLIATVTFAAGFTVPGGVYSSDDPILEKRGMAVLAGQLLFRIFMAFNTIAMYSSIFSTIILLLMQLGDGRYAVRGYRHALPYFILAIATMLVAFMAAICLVVSNNTWFAGLVSVIAFIFLSFFMFLFIFQGIPSIVPVLPFPHVRELLLGIGLCLFYGGEDNISQFEIGVIHQNEQDDEANPVNPREPSQSSSSS